MDEDVQSLTWTRSEPVGVPTSNGVFIMRIMEWKRLKRNLSEITLPIPWLQIVYSLFIGFFLSTLLSTVLVYYTEGLPSWVLPLYVIATISSILLGIICALLDRQTKRVQKNDVDRILNDMDDIERTVPQLQE